MKKKLILAAVSALSVLTLAACSGSSSNEIATMKGGKITVEDFYEQAKTDQNNQSLIRQLIVLKVFDQKYGDDVTEKMIDKQYDQTDCRQSNCETIWRQ